MISFSESLQGVDWDQLRQDLIQDDFHNGRTTEELKTSFENSAAVVFAWHEGRVVGKARALSDGVCNAYVVDVWTRSDHRRDGIAKHLMEHLEGQLHGQHVGLFTDDALDFYQAIGYQNRGVFFERVVGSWLGR